MSAAGAAAPLPLRAPSGAEKGPFVSAALSACSGETRAGRGTTNQSLGSGLEGGRGHMQNFGIESKKGSERRRFVQKRSRAESGDEMQVPREPHPQS